MNGGISAKSRNLLELLSRGKGPFTPSEIAHIWDLSPNKTNRLVAYLASKGWLSRLRRGLYITVPLGAGNPADRREDPWIMAYKIFAPCYVGGWTACEYWQLTEQIFKDTVIFTSKKPRYRNFNIKDMTYIIKKVSGSKLFGLSRVWKDQIKIPISDPSRTIVDLLDDPSIGGGIRNIADIINEYFNSTHRNDLKLIEYISEMKNKAVYKRLGYIIETLKINAHEIMKHCANNISSGYSKLDPTGPQKGTFIRRWNLLVNIIIKNSKDT